MELACNNVPLKSSLQQLTRNAILCPSDKKYYQIYCNEPSRYLPVNNIKSLISTVVTCSPKIMFLTPVLEYVYTLNLTIP